LSTILKALRRLEQEKVAELDRPLQAAVAEPPPLPAAPARRSPWILGAGIAVLVAAGAVVWSLRGSDEPGPTKPVSAIAAPESVPLAAAPVAAPPVAPAAPVAAAPEPIQVAPDVSMPPPSEAMAAVEAELQPQQPAAPPVATAAPDEPTVVVVADAFVEPKPAAAPAPIAAPAPAESPAPISAPTPPAPSVTAPAPTTPNVAAAPVLPIAAVPVPEASAAAPAPPVAHELPVAVEPPPPAAPLKETPVRVARLEPRATAPKAALPGRAAGGAEAGAVVAQPVLRSGEAESDGDAVRVEPPRKHAARVAPPPAPAITVVRTVWHPKPDRRTAMLEAPGDAAPREYREGDRVGALTLLRIEPSGVVFDRDGVEVRQKIESKP
jgi:hypothetical protein